MSIKIGTVHTGKVVRKSEFGVFVGINGARNTGLVHFSRLRGNSSDLRHQRLADIEIGEEMIVEVVSIEKTDSLTRMALSEKIVHDSLIVHHLPVDEAIRGVVTSKIDCGVIVLLPGWFVSGLLHVSRMAGANSSEQLETMRSFAVGGELEVAVKKITLDDDNLKLKLAQL